MVETKIFKTIKGEELVIKSRKSAVIFELNTDDKDVYKFKLIFDDNTFEEMYDYLLEVSKKCWSSIEIREVYNFASDYEEYYDSKLDSNGLLRLTGNILFIEKPSIDSNKLFQFNKTKMGTFLYEYKKYIRKKK